MKICSIENCRQKIKARGWCKLHYERWQRQGDPTIVLPQVKKKIPVDIRFWKYAIKNDDPNKCWKWIGTKLKFGYGIIRINYNCYLAHRIAYELLVKPIPKGLFVCHHCDNPECCNPKHLWLGTNKDNTNDRDKKGRCKSNVGINNPRCKLNISDVISIKKELANGSSLSTLARNYGLTKTSISRIKNEKAWKHVTI